MATQKKTNNRFSYAGIKFEEDGWCWNTDNKPIPFDIAYVEVERINGTKIISAWWTGKEWVGLRLKSTDLILRWRRQENINDERD